MKQGGRRRHRTGPDCQPALTCRPCTGVPFTVKDNIDVAGTPTTQGFKALAQVYPSRDAPSVERMKAAGAIPIGRTNLLSGAIRWHCDSESWGATINPWDRTRTPGASSAGEAADRRASTRS
jgi:amidase